MDYIRQMSAFIDRSAAVSLSASSYALYLQLFGLNNKRRWAEWFEASNAFLETVTGLTSKTIQKARQELIEKGFISVQLGDRRIPTQYHIIRLGEKLPYNGNSDESLGEVIGEKFPYKDNVLGEKFPQKEVLGESLGEVLGEVIGEKFPQKDAAEPTASMDSEPPKTKTKTKTNNNKQQQQYIPRACAREDEPQPPHSRDKPDDDLGEVMRTFSDNIHPVTGAIEADKLADLYDTYGAKWVIAAIAEAVECGGRNLRYISAILERWQRDGFKTQRKTKGAVADGAGERDHSADVSADETPWIQQLREWEERKRNSPRPWDIQPPAGGDRDAPGGDHPDRGRAG
ncbi:DnaD domain protein [Selenomonas artemidis]|uniref:DnaD domain protein n=1 Tax=Selenomonas artemidis TaxID=671224 RepID=UPI000407D81D|nr:DnaD domain protein [Selenomonas artemidis]